MIVLIVGLVLFLGIHLVPMVPALRTQWAAKSGEQKYKAAFSLISAVGLVLIIVGYGGAPAEPRWFEPFPLAVSIAPAALLVSFILLAAAHMKTHIRKTLKHPMLIGVAIWAFVHLLANGEVRTTVLFGAFFVYAIVDMISATSRGAVKTFQPEAKYDAMAVIGGIVVAVLVMAFHRKIFGVPAIAWSI